MEQARARARPLLPDLQASGDAGFRRCGGAYILFLVIPG